MKRFPLKLFFSYSHKDKSVRHELDSHLDVLVREGIITVWWDGELTAGERWSEAIEHHLSASDLIIFLISDNFFNSSFILENELPVALELEKESKGLKRIISILLEPTKKFDDSALNQMQRVPSGDFALSHYEDRTLALDQVAVEIRRAVMKIIFEAGGAFELGPHNFTQAELVQLDPKTRKFTSDGLRRLRIDLATNIPSRKLDKNLIVASWCLNRFASPITRIESIYYLAQVISAFDIVSLQKVAQNLDGLNLLLDILGPEWKYLITDVTLGAMGADERFAILYYSPRVTFKNISGGIVLPANSLIEGQQFARTPLLASFQTSHVHFRVCSTHIRFGENIRLRNSECEILASFLSRIAKRDKEEILLSGDFNLFRNSQVLKIFRESGIDIPSDTIHPTLWPSGNYCDLIGHIHGEEEKPRKLKFSSSSMVNLFDSVFRDEDKQHYLIDESEPSKSIDFKTWRIKQISDHLPVWVEFTISE